MLQTPMLRSLIDSALVEEALALRQAKLWIPLGPKPLAALTYLASRGLLDPKRIPAALPHPGGENGERIKYFLEEKRREHLSNKTNPRVIDHARDALRRAVAELQSQRASPLDRSPKRRS